MSQIPTDDPRSRGFNYGAGFDGPLPQIYHEVRPLLARLDAIAIDASKLAWGLNMYMRDVRLASTPSEQNNAIARLTAFVSKLRGEGGFPE